MQNNSSIKTFHKKKSSIQTVYYATEHTNNEKNTDLSKILNPPINN